MTKTTTEVWASLNGLAEQVLQRLPYVLISAVVFAAFYYGSKLLRRTAVRLSHRHGRTGNVGLVVGRLGQGLVVLVGILVSLSIALPTFRPDDIVQFLGIGSVAVGFAFRDILQNFLAGILILLTEPFRIGDQIVVNNFEGTVQDIQTRATFIRTYDGRRVVIPNAELFTNSVVVNTAFDLRRMEHFVRIGFAESIDDAKKIIMKAVVSVAEVAQDPAPQVLVHEFTDVAAVLRIWWWGKSVDCDLPALKDEVMRAIYRRLDEAGIDQSMPARIIQLTAEEAEAARQKAAYRQRRAD